MADKITITVADGHGDRIDEVVARLEAAGVQVQRVLEAIGVIVATVDPERRHALGEIEGVASIEQDRTVQLPPPDSDVQ